jgi:hypothetical protein
MMLAMVCLWAAEFPVGVEHRLGFAVQLGHFEKTALPEPRPYRDVLARYGRGPLVGGPSFALRSSHRLHPRVEVGGLVAYAFVVESRSRFASPMHMHVPQLGARVRVQDVKAEGAFGLELEAGAWIPILSLSGRSVATITPYLAPAVAVHIPTRRKDVLVRVSVGYAFRLTRAVLRDDLGWRLGGLVVGIGSDFSIGRTRSRGRRSL